MIAKNNIFLAILLISCLISASLVIIIHFQLDKNLLTFIQNNFIRLFLLKEKLKLPS